MENEPNDQATAPPSMPAEPRVFVTNEPLRKVMDETGAYRYERIHDVTAARRYGELVHVFPAGHLPDDAGYMVRTARRAMADFTADDYLLLIGDPLATVAAGVVASQVLGRDGPMNVLTWDRRVGRYVVRRLDLAPAA